MLSANEIIIIGMEMIIIEFNAKRKKNIFFRTLSQQEMGIIHWISLHTFSFQDGK